MRPSRLQTCGETTIGMRTAGKADNHHSCRATGSHTVFAILYDEALAGRRAQLFRRVEKEGRRRLSMPNEVSGIDMDTECRREACQSKLAVELVLLGG